MVVGWRGGLADAGWMMALGWSVSAERSATKGWSRQQRQQGRWEGNIERGGGQSGVMSSVLLDNEHTRG